MTAGKIAAQVAHAAVLGAEKTKRENISWFNSWYRSGQAKVVVKTSSLEELLKIGQLAGSLDLPVVEVHDSGLTQLPPGTTTCIGIGPAPVELIDQVTGGLKLL